MFAKFGNQEVVEVEIETFPFFADLLDVGIERILAGLDGVCGGGN